MPKIIPPNESKLSKTVAKIIQNAPSDKNGFLDSRNNKTTYYKTKSFRLRQTDSNNLSVIVNEINKISERKTYSDSEVIRGMINYLSDNFETCIKKIIVYVKDSS